MTAINFVTILMAGTDVSIAMQPVKRAIMKGPKTVRNALMDTCDPERIGFVSKMNPEKY